MKLMVLSERIRVKLILGFALASVLVLLMFVPPSGANAATCNLADICPSGYIDGTSCVAGKLGQNSSLHLVYGNPGDCKYSSDERKVNFELIYDFESRAIYSRTIEGATVAKARPDVSLASCLPGFKSSRIKDFKMVYQDGNGPAYIGSVDLCFKNQNGNTLCYTGAVPTNIDMQTCTIFDIHIVYDDNATSITRTSLVSGYTGCPGEAYADGGCKHCIVDGEYECKCDSDNNPPCPYGSKGSRIDIARFKVPGDYRLYTIRNTYFTMECYSDIWEKVGFDYESESTNDPPEVVSINARNTSCSSSWSGQYDNGANNPLSIRAKVTDTDGGDTIKKVYLALSSDESDDTGDAGCSNWERALSNTFGMYYDVSSGDVTIVKNDVVASGCPWDYSGDDENDKFAVESATHTVSGDDLTLDISLRFKDDFPTGKYKFFGMASDDAVSHSCSTNPGAGCYDEKSSWNVDLEVPSAQVNIYHEPGEAADTLHFDQVIQDDDPGESGIKNVFDRYYTLTRDGTSIKCDIADNDCSSPDGDKVTPSPPRSSWTIPKVIGGFKGGDDVSASIIAQDNACNTSSPSSSSTGTINERWMRTRFGDTYSALGYDVPIQTADTAFAAYWAGGRGSWNFNIGKASSSGWVSSGYDDDNKGVNWYNELRRLARKSDWMAEHKMQEISSGTGVINISGIGGDGMYEYTGRDDVTISGDCNGRKVIFVSQSGVEIAVEPDIHVVDDKSACMLVTKGDVEILSGGNSGVSPAGDVLEMAFVVGGEFRTAEDPNFNRLIIHGFVVANRTNFERDLVYEQNSNYPAELIDYDPRYLYLLGDMVGRRSFKDFGCGTVRGAKACEGWEED